MLFVLALFACTSKAPDTDTGVPGTDDTDAVDTDTSDTDTSDTDTSDTDTSDTDTGTSADGDRDGFAAPEDCDDADPDVHPGAPEHCDGVDEDCDGATDEDPVDGPISYAAGAGAPSSDALGGSWWMTSGDLDGDGVVDLAFTVLYGDAVQVLHGAGDGSFTETTSIPSGGEVDDLALGDLDDDGDLDVVFTGYQGTVTVALSDGTGGFATTEYAAGPRAIACAVADLDGDGHLDVVVGTEAGLEVRLGDGTGQLADASTLPTEGSNVGVTVGDVDGDGVPDLVASVDQGALDVFLGDGAGGFGGSLSTPVDVPSKATLADLDGDGHLDAVVPENVNGDVRVLLGAGDGTFSGTETHAMKQAYQAYVGDFDGDGALDVFGVGDPDVGLMHGHGDGTFDDAISFDTYGASYGVSAVGDVDGNGVDDLAWVVDGETHPLATVLGTRSCSE